MEDPEAKSLRLREALRDNESLQRRLTASDKQLSAANARIAVLEEQLAGVPGESKPASEFGSKQGSTSLSTPATGSAPTVVLEPPQPLRQQQAWKAPAESAAARDVGPRLPAAARSGERPAAPAQQQRAQAAAARAAHSTWL